jgi:hypothetical protein
MDAKMKDNNNQLISYENQAKIQFTLQGTINNIGFFLLISSSQSIAIGFGQKNLVSAITFSTSVASVCILVLNASLFVKYTPK